MAGPLGWFRTGPLFTPDLEQVIRASLPGAVVSDRSKSIK